MIPFAAWLQLFAMALQAIGEAFQKRGIAARALPVWAAGAGIAAVGVVASVQAISGLDVAVASTLATVKILFASLIAWAVLGEHLETRERIALAATFAGALLLAVDAAPSGEHALGTAATVTLAGAALALSVTLAGMGLRASSSRREMMVAVAAGVQLGMVNVLVKLATTELTPATGHFDVLRPGSVAELASLPVVWLVLASWGAGLALLQLAFRFGRYAVVGPVVTVSIAILGVAVGRVLFLEAIGPPRAIGMSVIAVGALSLLAQARATASSPVTPPQSSS